MGTPQAQVPCAFPDALPRPHPPVVYYELRPAESVQQALDALASVQSAAAEVLGAVSLRLAAQRARLAALDQRVAQADSRVRTVRGSPQATLVISPAEYPAPPRLPRCTPLVVGSAPPPPLLWAAGAPPPPPCASP